jgi:hypothetical protein
MSSELDLGSREKSPESVELTPAIGMERGETPTPEMSEISQKVVVGEPQADVEMAEKDPQEGSSQGGRSDQVDMQPLIAMMQQLCQNQENLKEGQEKFKQELKENQKQDSEKIVRELQQVEERIVSNYQRFQEKLKQELVDKITTEVGPVVTKVNKVREEIVNCYNGIEQEMGEENSIVEVSMSDISGRLREQPSKIKHDNVVDKIEIQGDNLMEQEIKAEETMQTGGVEVETSGLSGRLWENKSQLETENNFLQRDNDEMLLYQGQMFEEGQKSKDYSERKVNKSKEIKKRKQKWLKVYRKLKERAERKVN